MRIPLRLLIFGLAVASLTATALAGEGISLLYIAGAPVAWPHADAPLAGDVNLSFAVLADGSMATGGANCGGLTGMKRLRDHSSIDRAQIDGAVAVALRRWQEAARVSFQRVHDAKRADIIIGTSIRPHGIAFVDLETAPSDPGRTTAIQKAFVCLNPEQKWKLGFDGNLEVYDLVHVLTHEFGHTLGLDHPSARGHVMSFKYTERLRALTPLDQSSIQALYGVRTPPTLRVIGASATSGFSGTR